MLSSVQISQKPSHDDQTLVLVPSSFQTRSETRLKWSVLRARACSE